MAERKLSAILAADVVGFSRLMGDNEERTLKTLTTCREIIAAHVLEHQGRVFGSAGDRVIAEFSSPVEAVRCAVAFQSTLRDRNSSVAEDRRMTFRVGINLGDVIAEEDNLYGDGVNVAARLEGIAEPGGICISGTTYDHIKNKLTLEYGELGEQALKNIAEPVAAFSVRLDQEVSEQLVEADGGSVLPADAKPTVRRAIAVLPFQNMSGDPEQEYFSDGISEDIISVISRYHWLSVIARNSSFVYKGKAVDVREVARDLEVDYVLEGSVRKAGSRVRITAQLIEADSGGHLWTERYDRDLDDIFALQDEITETIAASIEPELARSERQRARRKRADNMDAWDLFQQAQWQMYQFSKENVASAISLYQQAIDLDGEFAPAQAGISVAYLVQVISNFTDETKPCIEAALRHGERAVVLDDQDPFCRYALGRAFAFSFQPAKAERELKRAIELNPSYAQAYHGLAQSYLMTGDGDWEVSLELLNDAIRLSPSDPLLWAFEQMKGGVLLNLERDDEAMEWYQKAASHPNAGFWAFLGLAACHSLKGEQAQAEAELARALGMNPGLSKAYFDETFPDALSRFKDALVVAGLK